MSSKTVNKTAAVPAPAATGTGVIGGASAVTDSNPVTTARQGSVPTLADIMRNLKSCSRLDEAAVKYIETIGKIFEDGHEGIVSLPISTPNVEARAFIHEASRYCINLIFAETHQTMDMTPPALRAKDVAIAVQSQHKDVQIIQTIVVSKEDYALAGKMAAFISNCFRSVDKSVAGNISIAAFEGVKLSVVTNIDAVRNFVRDVSPHAVPARDDIGILLCIDQPKGHDAFGNPTEVVQIPFMAITGYTRIMNPQDAATGMKFVPIPTITDIVTSILNPNLLAMALPLAADAFICKSLWCRPYATFRAGQPNLGNLIMDPSTKKPCFTDTAEAFHGFIRTYMTNPYLAIDITEGRARPLNLDKLVTSPNLVLDNVRSFLCADNTDLNKPVVNLSGDPRIMMFSNYTGTFMDKGTVRDTRCVDYLELATKVTDHKQINHLLLQPNQPHVKIEAVRGIFPEATRSLYVTTTVVLDAQVVGQIAAQLPGRVALNYDIAADGNYNIANLVAANAANDFSGFAAINTGFGRQNLIPTALCNIYSNLI